MPSMQSLLHEPSVKCGKGNMCAHGMWIDTKDGKQLALKATGWMTNSEYVLPELTKLCTNNGGPKDHAHAERKCS